MDANSLKKAETTPTGYENPSFSHDDQVTILPRHPSTTNDYSIQNVSVNIGIVFWLVWGFCLHLELWETLSFS